MGKDCRYYPNETPKSVHLSVENVNEIDILENLDTLFNITIKWLLKGKKPIESKIFLVNFFFKFISEFHHLLKFKFQ